MNTEAALLYYIQYGIKGRVGKIYGLIFAVVTVISVGLLYPESNLTRFPVLCTMPLKCQSWIITILAVILGLIIFGGVKWIANVATAVVPFMAIIYILMAVFIIILNIQAVPALFALILNQHSECKQQHLGNFRAMIEIGVKRDFTPTKPVRVLVRTQQLQQKYHIRLTKGLVQAFSVYVDTFICRRTATALIILISGTYNTTNGDVGPGGLPKLIKDNGIRRTICRWHKDYSGTAMYAQAGIDKALQGGSYHFDPAFWFRFILYCNCVILLCLYYLAYYYIAETNIAYMTEIVHALLQPSGLTSHVLS